MDFEGFTGHVETYDEMSVLYHTFKRFFIKRLEIALISRFKGEPHCSNIGKGGERVAKKSAKGYFLYVVFAR